MKQHNSRSVMLIIMEKALVYVKCCWRKDNRKSPRSQ